MLRLSRNRPIPDPLRRSGRWLVAAACLLAAQDVSSAEPASSAGKVADVIHGRAVDHLVEGTLVLTQDEINAYAMDRLRTAPVAGVDSLVVQLRRGAVVARVVVDAAALLSDRMPVVPPIFSVSEVAVVFEEGLGSSGGRIQYTFRRASVGSVSLPRTLFETLLTQAVGASKTVALTGDIPLWPGIGAVRVADGRIEILAIQEDGD